MNRYRRRNLGEMWWAKSRRMLKMEPDLHINKHLENVTMLSERVIIQITVLLKA